MEHIASISYGKDSLAMLEVIKQNGLPLDRIVTVDIMATKDVPADLPPMVEFKSWSISLHQSRMKIIFTTNATVRKARMQVRYTAFRCRKGIGATLG